MAVKTFTTGEVLTAADTNTYLNNGGLVYITQATYTTSTELNLLGIFSSTYDVYKLVFSETNSSGGTQLFFRMLSGSTPLTTNNYYSQRLYAQSTTVGAVSTGAVGYGAWGYQASGYVTGGEMTIYNPYLSQNTTVHANVPYELGYVEMNSSRVNNQVSYDGFRIYPSTGNLSGTVRVYGFRKA
jgi:hypothetical protein